MKKKINLIIVYLISRIPYNFLRCMFYRSFFDYHIKNTKIRYGTIILSNKVYIENSFIGKYNEFIDVQFMSIRSNTVIGMYNKFICYNSIQKINLEGCQIGKYNEFIGPISVTVRSGANIVDHNSFISGLWTLNAEFKDHKYERILDIESNTLITEYHFIDIAGSFILGENSWIAGRESQFLTHGAGIRDHDIQIGKNCYIGSAVRFPPGSKIADNVIVGMGSVLTKKFEISNAMIARVPAKVIKQSYDWKTRQEIK